MPNITLSLPQEIHKIVKKHNEIRWSEIARRAISKHAMELELMDRITSKSKLTEKDVKEIGDKIKSSIAKRHGLAI